MSTHRATGSFVRQIQPLINLDDGGIRMPVKDIHIPNETRPPTGLAFLLASSTRQETKKPRTLPAQIFSLFSQPASGPQEQPSPLKRQMSKTCLVTTENIKDLVPIERPCYTLFTTQNIYIFSPLYLFPLSNERFDGTYSAYESASRAQFNYDDDPSRYIRLRFKFSLEKIKQISVGPGDQYLCIEYSSDTRVVLLIRDGNVVRQIVESLGSTDVPITRYTVGTGVGWWDAAFLGSVVLKPDDLGRRILYNGVDELAAITSLREYMSAKSVTPPREALPVLSRSWIASLLASSSSASGNSEATLTSEHNTGKPKAQSKEDHPVIRPDETDPDGTCSFYALAGLIIPTSSSKDASPAPPVLRSCSIACTTGYIYFLLERYCFFRLFPTLTSA